MASHFPDGRNSQPPTESHLDRRLSSKDAPDNGGEHEPKPFWEEEKPWRCDDPLRFPIPDEGNGLEACRKIIDSLDRSMCDGWNGEIQNLLIFAGLFSAIVTAFSVEVAKELQEPPEAASVQLLARISAQLEANSSPTDIPLPQLEPFVAAPSTVRINLLWMISLTSSLAVVTIGILCLQWIRAYQRQYSGRSLKEAIAARNSRNSSLQSWHVPLIITLLPILLQVAVALFLIGLVEYFYHMNHTIGYVLGALVGTTLFFVVATTILPALCDFFFYYYGGVYGYSSGVFPVSCAYKSPQAWGFTMLCSRLVALWCMVFKNASRPVRSFAKVKNLANWSAYDRWWSHTSEVQSNYIWGLCRMARQFQHGDPVVTRSVYSCVRDLTTVQDLDHFNRYMYGPQERPLGQTFDPTQVNLIKDYVMYKVGLQMFSSSEDFHVPMGEWEHLHRLELFVRLYQNLPEGFREEVFVASPAVVDGSVNENRTIPRLPDELRIQLFKIFKTRLDRQNHRDRGSQTQYNMMLLLGSLVVHPFNEASKLEHSDQSMDTSSQATPQTHPRTFSMIEAGFRTIADQYIRAGPAAAVAPDLFAFCVLDWTLPSNRQGFVANQALLLNSPAFWECMGNWLKDEPESRTQPSWPSFDVWWWPHWQWQLDATRMTIDLPESMLCFLDEDRLRLGVFQFKTPVSTTQPSSMVNEIQPLLSRG